MIEFMLYALRWQLSTPILYLVMKKIGTGVKGTIIANAIGAVIFFFIDKWIFM